MDDTQTWMAIMSQLPCTPTQDEPDEENEFCPDPIGYKRPNPYPQRPKKKRRLWRQSCELEGLCPLDDAHSQLWRIRHLPDEVQQLIIENLTIEVQIHLAMFHNVDSARDLLHKRFSF